MSSFPMSAFFTRLLRGFEGVFSPQAAVLTFFVLSGHVLGISLRREPRVNAPVYLAFMIKRLFRVMAPLIILVTLSALLITAVLGARTGSTYVDPATWGASLLGSTYNRPFNALVLLQNIVLYAHDLDSVTWTISIEMVGSALIPLFFWLNRQSLMRFVLLACLILAAVLCKSRGNNPVFYLYIFDLGLLIACWGPPLFRWLRAARLLPVAIVAALVLTVVNSHFGRNYFILAPALTLLLAHIVLDENPSLHLLDSRPAIWLGQVSYSFYLLHWPVLWILAWSVKSVAPAVTQFHPLAVNLALLAVSVPAAAGLSAVSYRFVELPCVQIGQRLIKRLRPPARG